jgi:molecular chaperone Hsp33
MPESPHAAAAPTPIPRGSMGPDLLVRTISTGGTIAVKAICASALVAEGLSRRLHAPTAGNALGRAMMGALLIAVGSAADDADDANVESVQLQFRGNGPLGSLTAIADSRARVRGTVQHPEVALVLSDDTPDIARAVGLGPLNVVRHRPRWRTPYTGTVPLVSGEIAGDLTLYLTESEQTPSAMGLGVSFGPGMEDVAACGFLVQALPEATDEDLAQVEANVNGLPPLTSLMQDVFDPDQLIDRLMTGLGTRARHTMHPCFDCPCSAERAARTLALLDRSELEEMIAAAASQEVVCDFCGRAYLVDSAQMQHVLDAVACEG